MIRIILADDQQIFRESLNDYFTTIIPVRGITPYQQYSVRIPLVIKMNTFLV